METLVQIELNIVNKNDKPMTHLHILNMAPKVQEVDDHPVRLVFSPSEKMFACNLKLKGKKYPSRKGIPATLPL